MTHKHCVPDELYGQLKFRLDDLCRRIKEGTLSFDLTMNGLQGLIEGTQVFTLTIGGPSIMAYDFIKRESCSLNLWNSFNYPLHRPVSYLKIRGGPEEEIEIHFKHFGGRTIASR